MNSAVMKLVWLFWGAVSTLASPGWSNSLVLNNDVISASLVHLCCLRVGAGAAGEKRRPRWGCSIHLSWSPAAHVVLEGGIKRWVTPWLRRVGRSLWGWLTPDRTTVTDSSCLPRAPSDWLSQKQFPASCSCPLAASLNVSLTSRCLHTHIARNT